MMLLSSERPGLFPSCRHSWSKGVREGVESGARSIRRLRESWTGSGEGTVLGKRRKEHLKGRLLLKLPNCGRSRWFICSKPSRDRHTPLPRFSLLSVRQLLSFWLNNIYLYFIYLFKNYACLLPNRKTAAIKFPINFEITGIRFGLEEVEVSLACPVLLFIRSGEENKWEFVYNIDL